MKIFFLTSDERQRLNRLILTKETEFSESIATDGKAKMNILTDTIVAITHRAGPYYQQGMGMDDDDLLLIDKATTVLSELETLLERYSKSANVMKGSASLARALFRGVRWGHNASLKSWK